MEDGHIYTPWDAFDVALECEERTMLMTPPGPSNSRLIVCFRQVLAQQMS